MTVATKIKQECPFCLELLELKLDNVTCNIKIRLAPERHSQDTGIYAAA